MEVCGRFNCSDCQWSPSSNETHTEFSVPANSKPLRTGSSRTVSTGPKSGRPGDQLPGFAAIVSAVNVGAVVDAEAAHGGVGGVVVEVRGADLRDLAPGREFRGVMSFQFLPPSRVMPDQAVVGAGPERIDVLERRRERVDDAALFVGAFGARLPTLAGMPGFSRVRSGLMVCQEFPPSVVLKSTLPAK
jgi:hypothetical protein